MVAASGCVHHTESQVTSQVKRDPAQRSCGHRPRSVWPALCFASLFGQCVQSRYWPVRLPNLHGVDVDEPPGGCDGGFIITAIQLNHADGSVVKPHDICTIDRHLGLQVQRSANACPKDDSERVGI